MFEIIHTSYCSRNGEHSAKKIFNRQKNLKTTEKVQNLSQNIPRQKYETGYKSTAFSKKWEQFTTAAESPPTSKKLKKRRMDAIRKAVSKKRRKKILGIKVQMLRMKNFAELH